MAQKIQNHKTSLGFSIGIKYKIALIVTLKVPSHVTSGWHVVGAVFRILMCDMSLGLHLLDGQDPKK